MATKLNLVEQGWMLPSAGLTTERLEVTESCRTERRLAPVGRGLQGTSVSSAERVFTDRRRVVMGTGVVNHLAADVDYKSIVLQPRSGKGATGGVPPRGRPDHRA